MTTRLSPTRQCKFDRLFARKAAALGSPVLKFLTLDVFEEWRVITHGSVGRALRIQLGESF